MTDRIRSAGPRMPGRILAASCGGGGHAALPRPTPARSNRRHRHRPQQPRPAPRPAQPAKPAQPAPQAQPAPAQPQQQQAEQPQLIFSPWVKLCNKDPDPNSKRVCVTVKDGRVESGLLVVSVAIIEMDGEQRKLMRMSLPYGVALHARHPHDRRPGHAGDRAVRDLPAAGRAAGRLHRRLRGDGRH